MRDAWLDHENLSERGRQRSDGLRRGLARGADHESDFVIFPQAGGQAPGPLGVHLIVADDELDTSTEDGHGARCRVLEAELEPGHYLLPVHVEGAGEGLIEADLDRRRLTWICRVD